MKTFCTVLAFAAFAATTQAIKLAEDEPAQTTEEFTCEIPIAHCNDFYYSTVKDIYKNFLAPYFDGIPHAVHEVISARIEDGGSKEEIQAGVNHDLEIAGQVSHAWMRMVIGHAFISSAEVTYEHANEMADDNDELVFWEDDELRDMVDEEHEAALEALDLDRSVLDEIEEYFDDYEGDELYEDWLGEDHGDDHVEHCDIEIPVAEVNAALIGLEAHAHQFHDRFLAEAERMLSEVNRVIYEEINAAFAAHDELTEEVIAEYEGHYLDYLHELSEQAYFEIEYGALEYCYGATDVFAASTSLATDESYAILDDLSAELDAQYEEAFPAADDSTADDDSTAGDDSTPADTTA